MVKNYILSRLIKRLSCKIRQMLLPRLRPRPDPYQCDRMRQVTGFDTMVRPGLGRSFIKGYHVVIYNLEISIKGIIQPFV